MTAPFVPLAVAIGLLLPPAPIAGLAAQEPDASAPASDPMLDRAEDLYDRGRARFETVDYQGAIELWTEAYGILPDTPTSAAIKAALIYNIATAQDRAYNIDHDLAHLRAAVELTERYLEEIPLLYPDTTAADVERTKAGTELEELRARIAEAEAAENPEPAPAPISLPPERIYEPVVDATAKPLIISGAVLTAVGVGGLSLMAAGLSIGNSADSVKGLDPDDLERRQERFDQGRRGNTLAYVGGIAGGIFLATGAVLLGLGIKRKRDSGVSASAMLGPEQAGASVSGRF